MQTSCPECGTTLRSKSPAGFAAGTPIACPKCETYFDPGADAAPPAKPARRPRDDDDEDERPRRSRRDDDDEEYDERPRKNKKRRRDDDDDDETGWQKYKKSPVRFVVLAVLLVAMAFLGYKLYEKKQREKDQDKDAAVPAAGRAA